MFICLTSAIIRNTRIKLGTTWVSHGLLQIPNVRMMPSISSIANRINAKSNGFQAARYFFCAACWNIVRAMNPAKIDNTTVANCAIP